MAESFPAASGSGDDSFPRGPDAAQPTGDGTLLLFRRYRVIRELGRGGMGVVLLAHDTALDIPVAVKLVPDMVVKDTEAIADLRKEVLRGIALAHPGIVRTHNFERDESGAGIVMEFVEGDTLTDLKGRQPSGCFDPEQILPWLDQLCAVLDYAHREARIVHRDLKPRNVMLTPGGRIKVADFGIAAVLSDSMSRHSMEGILSGTVSYMSPQQAEGKRPSHLDDIHSLGATIYELLTGKPPFFRGNQAAIFSQVLQVVPPALAERREDLEVTGKLPLPLAWEETIAACLAKDPAQRPQSAGEVLGRLRVGWASRPPFSASRGEPPMPAHLAPAERLRETSNPAGGTPTLPGSIAVQSPAPGPRRVRWPWTALVAATGLAAWAAFHIRDGRDGAPRHPDLATPLPAPAPLPATSKTTVPIPARDTPMPATPPPAAPKPPPSVAERLAAATKDAPFENSLGQRFVPAGTPGVLFCVWETRVKDFTEFIRDSGHDMSKGEKIYTLESGGWKQAGGDWRNPRFPQPQGEDHPVVCVSWEDATAFCAWLTKKERASGLLTTAQSYRLPSDHAWSVAVGIGDRESAGASPESKDGKIEGVYPWGTGWPPPRGAGNLRGEESKGGAANTVTWTVIAGYNDGFLRTAPVGGFTPNVFGLYDLSGNVWEWCEEEYKSAGAWRVLRGGSWLDAGVIRLRSSDRYYDSPTVRRVYRGFRCVVSVSGR